MDADSRHLATIRRLERELETSQKVELYYRSIAYYLAGYFHQAALEQGIHLCEAQDLVDWAAKQNGAQLP